MPLIDLLTMAGILSVGAIALFLVVRALAWLATRHKGYWF